MEADPTSGMKKCMQQLGFSVADRRECTKRLSHPPAAALAEQVQGLQAMRGAAGKRLLG